MPLLQSQSALDMTTLFAGYQLSSGTTSESATALSFNLFFPGGFFPPITVEMEGTGFTFDADGVPTGGTVTAMSVFLDRLDPINTEASFLSISIPLTTILPAGPSEMIDPDVLFAAMLSGSDTLDLGSGSIGYGDMNLVSGFTGVFANDTMTLVGTDGILYGDAQVILADSDVTGGDDTLSATGDTEFALRLIGDAQGMTGGTMRGGADVITWDIGGTAFGQNLSVGDVQEVAGTGVLIAGNDTMTGAATLADQMYGDAEGLYSTGASITGGNDDIDGRGGNDLIYGDLDVLQGGTLTPGNDTLKGGDGNDILYGDVARLSSGGTVLAGGHDLLMGGIGNDALVGNGGNDTLDGGTGADTLVGGDGDDVYLIDADDLIGESADEGTDEIRISASYSLGDNFENLTLLGTANLDGTGNVLGNAITGTSGANVLDGGAGDDTLTGGGGDDTYKVDSTADRIVENSGEGTDTVQARASFSLRDNSQFLEDLVLLGQSDLDATGNGLHNRITGNAGSNVLNGAMGNDTLIGDEGDDRFVDVGGVDSMEGGLGDDSYRVDNIYDRVVELAGEGTDTIESTIALALRNVSPHVENLTLLGAAAIDGTGNALNNVVTGSQGNNVLNGAWGNDTLIGLGGADRFIDDAGADRMEGGAGNDYYRVDSLFDRVIELAGEGFDKVESEVDFALRDHGQEIESLTLLGTANLDGTGNVKDNVITGNAGDNVLNGAWGNDTLIGGAGNDVFDDDAGADRMIGGMGDDTYLINAAGDTVVEQAGEGFDRVYSSLDLALRDLSAHVEALELLGEDDLEGIGNGLDNLLIGNAGNNRLEGGFGADTLSGGAGDDILVAGGEADVFQFVTEAASGVDWVADFQGGADQIELAATAFPELTSGALSAAAFHIGTSAADASDRVIYDSATGALRYDADGVGGADAILFARLGGTPSLDHGDIFVI